MMTPSDSVVFIWRFDTAELDEGSRELRVGGELVDIEPRPLNLMLLLLQHAGEIVTNDEIIAKVWAGRIVSEATITNAVSKLRKVLGDDSRKVITTVSKSGYRLTATVERLARQRRTLMQTALRSGDSVPSRPHWLLTDRLNSGGYGDSWLGRNVKTNEVHVFKFCVDAERLSALKRELTLFRILRELLAERAPLPAVFEWQFDNTPYYIETEKWGEDLQSWAEKSGGLQSIPLERRLKVLALAAEAVATIHSVCVLHKDLKPSNILLSDREGALQVRLCDFGNSILLDDAELDALSITRQGFTHTVAGVGTPNYMAPELLHGGTPSVQSDIYSLGVVLYQFVVGDWRPLTFGWESDIQDELLRTDIASTTARDPLQRLPSAQLIKKGLLTIQERREKLDYDRQAEARTISDRQALERSQAQRPWIIAFVGMLFLGIAVSSTLMVRAQHSAEIAYQNEQVARNVASFLSGDMVHQASPDYGGHVDITLKKAILESIPKIPQRLSDSAPTAAALDQSLADALATLSDPADAAQIAHQAAALYSRTYGSKDLRTLAAQVDEFSYRILTEPEAAVSVAFRSLDETISHVLPISNLISLKAGLIRARLYQMQGRNQESLDLLRELLERYPALPDAEQMSLLDRTHLAYIKALLITNRYDEAKDVTKKLLPHFVHEYGSESRTTLELHRDLGRAYMAEHIATHEFGAAEAEFQIAVRGSTSLYGADSTEVDFALQDLNDLYELMSRWGEAEALSRRLYSDFEAHYGPASLWTWRARDTLLEAITFRAFAEPSYSKSVFQPAQETLESVRKTLSKNDYMYNHILVTIAISFIAAGHDEEVPKITDELDAIQNAPSAAPREKAYFKGELDYISGLLAQHNQSTQTAVSFFTAAINELTPIIGPDGNEILDARHRLATITPAVAPVTHS